MAKEIDKIIQSKTAPKSNNVLWDDGENLKINRNGKWDGVVKGAFANVTYAELVELRDNGELIAGMQYRITDYVTTTAQENTRSAGHQFDVIVTADNKSTLNEVARACRSEFDIEKYKDAYSSTLGNKMLYMGTQEYEGKEYYLYEAETIKDQMLVDFNHSLETYLGTEIFYPFEYFPSYARIFDGSDWGVWEYGKDYGESIAFKYEEPNYFDSCKLEAWQIWYSLDNDAERFAWADAENGKGVIYRMIDEWNNDCPYDFKNIIYVFKKSFMYNQWGGDYQFMRDSSLDKVIDGTQYYGYSSATTPSAWSEGKCWVTDENVTIETQLYNADGSAISYGGTKYNISNESLESFTFNEGVLNDFSLEGEYCYGNTILAWNGGLNRIVFKNDKTYEYQGQYVHNCYSNSFGNECYSNSFGNDCHSNSFGNRCDSNSFGEGCNYNSFGNDCDSNVFGNSCDSNSFGNGCYSNSFGNDCDYNVFGNRCNYNSFGNDSQSNELKAYYRYITFGEGVQYVTLQNNTEGGYENLVQNYRVANGIHGEYGNPLVVDVTRNMGCETFIGMDSNDKLKVFCLADLLNS